MLNAKQELFCQEFVRCYNATEAYQRVYGTQNRHTACRNAWKLMGKPHIKERIVELQKDIYEERFVNKERLAVELINIVEDEAANRKDKLKAIELLSKTLGYQQETIELNQKITFVDDFES